MTFLIYVIEYLGSDLREGLFCLLDWEDSVWHSKEGMNEFLEGAACGSVPHVISVGQGQGQGQASREDLGVMCTQESTIVTYLLQLGSFRDSTIPPKHSISWEPSVQTHKLVRDIFYQNHNKERMDSGDHQALSRPLIFK